MSTFEDLPLGPETVAALAAEGMEVPTPFQAAAIPVISRGKDLMGRAGPGSGTLVAYGAPLIDRLEGGAGAPACLVLCSGARQATELARSFALLCDGSGLRAAALAPHWNLPERADFLFVPADRLSALYDGTVPVDRVRTVVVHDGDGVVKSVPRDHLEAFLTGLPSDCQRVFCGLPFGPELLSIARRFTSHAVTVPPGHTGSRGRSGKAASKRDLHFTVVEGDRSESVLALTAELLGDTVRHVLLYATTADQAADLGDYLAVHGYHAGPPGDETVPVWLCPAEEEAEARAAIDALADPDQVATVSCTVPAGAQAATARHGGSGGPAWALPAVRELGHLRQTAAEAGLKLKRVRPERPTRVSGALDQLADRLHEAARAPEATPYYLLVESLLDRFTAAEVAAAALLLLDRGSAKSAVARTAGKLPEIPESWVRLFVSAGKRDEIGPRELLGALTSESGVAGKRVGRIDVRESHSLIEVYESDAGKVIKALNGTTLGGRSLRVDYDRAKDRRPKDRRSPGKPGGGPPRGRPSRPPFRRGASGTSDRGKPPPRRTGRS
ncbi:MAG: DbpA RNA binding domain-containing protein [Gammaproteobacteria bacterium]|nr:DbpA RNA binding domain-containing protein [Gammaproteobacteria bacterium]